MRDLTTEMISNRMVIKNEHNFGDIVFLKTDEDQLPRMVTGINIRPDNVIIYALTCGTDETDHYSIEISKDKIL